MSTNPKQTYQRIRDLADDERAPETERAAARAALGRIAARYGDAATEPPAPESTAVLVFTNGHERTMAITVALFYGLDPLRTGYKRPDGKGTRWRDQVTVTGPADLVDLAVAAYARQRGPLAELLEVTAHGYILGAFPVPRPVPADPDRAPVELADHLVDAFYNASAAGRAQANRRAITGRERA